MSEKGRASIQAGDSPKITRHQSALVGRLQELKLAMHARKVDKMTFGLAKHVVFLYHSQGFLPLSCLLSSR